MPSTIAQELDRIKTAKIEIADAIGSKGVMVDLSDTIDKYPDYIKRIGPITLDGLSVTQNDTYEAADGEGWNKVVVNVAANPNLQTLNVTGNGTYTPTAPVDGYDEVNVTVLPNLQNKTVTSNATYTCDPGYDGLGTVTVNVVPASTSKVKVYYNVMQDVFHSYNYVTGILGYKIFNNGNNFANNISQMWVDGVLQNSISDTYVFLEAGIHEVIYELNSNSNDIPGNTFNNDVTYPILYIDLSEYTGTSVGTLNMEDSTWKIIDNNKTYGGFSGGKYYLGDSVSFLNPSFSAQRLNANPNNPGLVSDPDGLCLTDNLYNMMNICDNNAVVPEGVTLIKAIDWRIYLSGVLLPKTLDDFDGFGGNPFLVGFKSDTPPSTITQNGPDMQGGAKVCVPYGSESLYATAFLNAGYNEAANGVTALSIAKGTFVYSAGDDYILLGRDGENAVENVFLQEIYDSNDNLVYSSSRCTNSFNILSKVLPTPGMYTVKWYFLNQNMWSWSTDRVKRLFQYADSLTVLDLSEIYDSTLGAGMVSNCLNLADLTIGSNITDIEDNFCYNCPDLGKVHMLATTPPNINGSSGNNFENSGSGNPIQVIVPNVGTYQGNADWANLEARGLIYFSPA